MLAEALAPSVVPQPLLKEVPDPYKHCLQSCQALSLKEAEGRLLREELSRSMQELQHVRQEAQSRHEQAEVSPVGPSKTLSTRPGHRPCPAGQTDPRCTPFLPGPGDTGPSILAPRA